ncbi:hypothetical protein ACFQX6_51340 [Streptosporangium lutulentum]
MDNATARMRLESTLAELDRSIGVLGEILKRCGIGPGRMRDPP